MPALAAREPPARTSAPTVSLWRHAGRQDGPPVGSAELIRTTPMGMRPSARVHCRQLHRAREPCVTPAGTYHGTTVARRHHTSRLCHEDGTYQHTNHNGISIFLVFFPHPVRRHNDPAMAYCGQHLAEKFFMLLRFLYMPLFLASSAAFLVEYPIIICKRSLDDILLCTQTLESCSRNE